MVISILSKIFDLCLALLLIIYLVIRVYWAQLIVFGLLIVFAVFLVKNKKKKNTKRVIIFSSLIITTVLLTVAFYIIFPTHFPYADAWIYGKTSEEIQAVYGEPASVRDDRLSYAIGQYFWETEYYCIELDESGKAVEIYETLELWPEVRFRTIVNISVIILAVVFIFICLFSFTKYSRLERLADIMSHTRNKVILCILIAYIVGGVIYSVADSNWEEKQRDIVAQDFLEAMATVDEETFDLYCDEKTSVGGYGENYEEFRYEMLPEWKALHSEEIVYEITGAPNQLPETYFFKIEYYDENGKILYVSGYFKISRSGSGLKVEELWLNYVGNS